MIIQYVNQRKERIETGSKTVNQILDHINSVAEEMSVNDMLTKAGLLGQKLDTEWGVRNDTGIANKTPPE